MFKKSLYLFMSLMAVVLLAFVWGCDDDEDVIQVAGNTALKLSPLGLPSLMEEDELIYELWVADLETDTIPTSLGKFFWDNDSYKFINYMGYKRSDVFNLPVGMTTEDYNFMFLTIEPYPDPSTEMSYNDIFYGFIYPDYPILEIACDPLFAEAQGSYLLSTLTDNNLNINDTAAYELCGLWFLTKIATDDFVHANLDPSLIMPAFTEAANMTYESWVYKTGWLKPLSMGKFRSPNYRDLNNPYIDNKYAPLVPGEDFLHGQKAPSWIKNSFPLELVGGVGDDQSEVFITLEPYPDPDPDNPFPLRLMSRNLPFLENETDRKTLKAHRAFVLGNRYIELPTVEVVRTARDK